MTVQGDASGEAREYFDFLAKLGLTKHIGSMSATRELVELCGIGDGSLVLDVGCGVGATPRYLARSYDARVVGVDLLERMVRQARALVGREGAGERVSLGVADARALPFADAAFDAVLVESVNVFFEDKGPAMEEYVRVTRPGGYVGVTEMTWLKPPSPEVADYYLRTAYARPLNVEGWTEALEGAELQDVVARPYALHIPTESRDRIARYGCRNYLRIFFNALFTLFGDRSSRAFMNKAFSSVPKEALASMGYGVYAGRKPSPT
jgi:ubiquinone/menaquinone biosynthesis C-methylase UbiE